MCSLCTTPPPPCHLLSRTQLQGIILLHFLQAFQPRDALIQTPKTCTRKEERGTMSPGSPSSGAAPPCMESSSIAEPLCSTQSFQPCLAASRISLPVRFPAPERGFRARMMLHARLVADCGARSMCLGDLKVTSACTQPPHRGRISLAQIQHSSPRFVVLLTMLHPRGSLQLGLGWDPAPHRGAQQQAHPGSCCPRTDIGSAGTCCRERSLG